MAMECQVKKSRNIEEIMFLFIVIDILFLPYFTLMTVSYSVPIVWLWAIYNHKVLFRGREGKIILAAILIMFVSTCINPIYSNTVVLETTFSTSVKRLIQYITLFFLLIFFKEIFKKYNKSIDKILLIFFLYVFVLSCLFFLFPYKYGTLKLAINPSDNHTRRFLQGILVYRFNFLWTDPNNVAYAIAGIEIYLLLRGKLSTLKKFFVLASSMFIILATASAGGIVSFIVGNFLLFLSAIFNNSSLTVKIKVNTLWIGFFLIVLSVIILFQTNLFESIVIPMVTKFQNRMTVYQTSNNITGGRLDDFKHSIAMMSPIFLFVGSGHEGFTTEIGHLYLIGMYGVITYVCYMNILFGRFGNQKKRDYAWIAPFFIGFTMNICIGEYKWLAIYLLLLAICRYRTDEIIIE